jgi:hypothetical protein
VRSEASLRARARWNAVNNPLQFGFDRHAFEHADVSASGISDRHDTDGRTQHAQDDAHRLPEGRNDATSPKFDLEHQTMGYCMRPDEGLAYDVGAFEVTEGSLELAPGNEWLRQSDLVVESGPLNRIHLCLPYTWA